MDSNEKVNFYDFHDEYHGHRVRDLELLLPHLRESCDSIIWTAGDSSLDNKYWFNDTKNAVGAYAQVLAPPKSRCDVTYWLNYLAQNQHEKNQDGEKIGAINTAVEATTLNERATTLRDQDTFLRDNIGHNDVLVVSIGGNDVAMRPTPCTILNMAGLMCLPTACIENGNILCTMPVDDYCCGCGPSLLSTLGACPPCLGYFRHLFGVRSVQKYIEKLTSKTKPKKVLVCMIYYLDEKRSPSWANTALSALGYDNNPSKLQAFIKKSYEEATSNIKINGTEVVPVPLFHALDGKDPRDYVARVEPSARGGKKMAEFLLDIINRPCNSTTYNTMER